MADISLDEQLKQEETLKNIIREAINSICEKEHDTYPNICKYCARSESDRNTVVNDVFKMMTADSLPTTLLGALSQVESKLDGWGE